MAYTATVTLTNLKSWPLPGLGPIKILTGECDITEYNTTLAEITGITKYFKKPAALTVVAGASDNGYLFEWIEASKAFKVWKGDYTSTGADGPLVQASNADDAGSAHFIVIGI